MNSLRQTSGRLINNCRLQKDRPKENYNKSMQNTKPTLAHTMRRISIFSLLLCAAIPAQAQTTNTPISNLNQPSSGYSNIGGGGLGGIGGTSQAVSFTTGNTPSWLSSVSLSMHTSIPSGTISPLSFSPYLASDSGGSPGTELVMLQGSNAPTNSEIYTYTSPNAVRLQTNTTYWIVAVSFDSFYYKWNVTTNRSLDSGSVWTLGNALSAPAYPQFSVAVTTVASPPLISVFRPVVLTFTNFQNSFVLQESPDLSGTNWTLATGLIQLAPVNDNRTVFLVPPSEQQMYFRLVAP